MKKQVDCVHPMQIKLKIITRMKQADSSNVQINIVPSEPIIFEMASEEQERGIRVEQNNSNHSISSESLVSRWQMGATIILNFLYLLVAIVLPIPTANITGKYFLVSFVLISYIIYIAVSYTFSKLNFMLRLKDRQQYEQVYRQYTAAECTLKFTYVPTRNGINQEIKKFQEEYWQIKIIDRSQKLQPLQGNYSLACVKYNKKYFYSDRHFRGEINSAFSLFIQKCKSTLDKHSRRLLTNRQKIDFIIDDFRPEYGFCLDGQSKLRIIYFLTFGLGFSGYFEYYMSDKVLRKEIDIVKEICRRQK